MYDAHTYLLAGSEDVKIVMIILRQRCDAILINLVHTIIVHSYIHDDDDDVM